MGDFNQKYEDYKTRKNQGLCTRWNHMIFESLDNQHYMLDVTKTFFDVTINNPVHTFYHFNKAIPPSRIDYIWMTQNLFLQLKDHYITEPDDITSDHRMLIASLFSQDIFSCKQYAKLKK
jgi:endonuclease/exonuclease/phosphatase family metal-dependent hydrolase